MIDQEHEVRFFWEVLRKVKPESGGYFDRGICAMFATAADIRTPAWMKVQWPNLEIYLYDETPNGEAVEALKKVFTVVKAERPMDHNTPMTVDWVVEIEIE